jgi:hypothetical protein
MKIIVHHLERDLAIAHGLGSDSKHIFPLADVSFVGYQAGAGQRGTQAVLQLWDARCYVPVAVLNGVDLDEAYTLTNSVDRPWEETCKSLRSRQRSTSVGDVLEVVADGSSTFHIVASTGFQQMGAA